MASNISTSIRERHRDALKTMLNLNKSTANVIQASQEPVWKLLIYDRTGQDILSPLFSVKELREFGITLHMLLHSDRDSIPDVPAIYFVIPTSESVQRICQDLRNSLYSQFYLNFITPISAENLQHLARASLECNETDAIKKVYDQYCHFISLEDEMFILRDHDRDYLNYYSLNMHDATEAEIKARIDSVVESIFSLLVTMGVIPIIRSPIGNAAELIAEKLDQKLRDNLRNQPGLFSMADLFSGSSLQLTFQRPLLLILDRNCDMATPLHHTWTYQALAHDLLDYRLNQVKIDSASASTNSSQQVKKSPKKIFDLNVADKFWQDQKGNPFPQVAESVQEELEVYRNSEEEVKKLKNEMGLEGDVNDETISLISDTTQKLTSAVSSLPELLEKKRNIDIHTTIATCILDEIKSRKLDIYFEIEQKIINKQVLDKSSIMELILDPLAGNAHDKIRILLICLLCSHPELTDLEVNQLCKSLIEGGHDEIGAIAFIRRWKSFSKMLSTPIESFSNVPGGGGTKTVNMFSKLVSRGSQFVMEGVKNFVVKKSNLPVTRITDAIMEGHSNEEVDEFRTYDPRLLKATSSPHDGYRPISASSVASGPLGGKQQRSQFQNAIVFVVGGGNYIEYQNLMDYSKGSARAAPKRIIYGCTELVNPTDFLNQLTKLGNQI